MYAGQSPQRLMLGAHVSTARPSTEPNDCRRVDTRRSAEDSQPVRFRRLPGVEPTPIVVEVLRGAVVEARHVAHAVAVQDGTIVAAVGDPQLQTYLRSAAKPLQALPLVRARDDLTDVEIAIACASHLARPDQLEAGRSLLARRPPRRRSSSAVPIRAPRPSSTTARASMQGCWLSVARPAGRAMATGCLGIRASRRCWSEIAAAAGVDGQSLPVGVDGCGVPTFGLTLERMASAFAGFSDLDGASHVARAMRAHPDLIRGPGAADTELMRALPGWIAKGGAEGVLCAASTDGLGVALKIEDGGNSRGSAARSRRFWDTSVSTPGSSPSSRWRTRGARSSARSDPSG